MGQRHNRRRNRPGRGRGSNKFSSSFRRQDATEAFSILSSSDILPPFPTAPTSVSNTRHPQLLGRHELPWRPSYDAKGLDEEQRRIFGGEIGDEQLLQYVNHLEVMNPQRTPPYLIRPHSRQRRKKRVSFQLPLDDAGGQNEGWDMISSITLEPESEGWILLDEDSQQ
ncbi:MAG: hypothetical protein M1825_004614 [Sarcosagium campestre]|nr:MAG: hypothetical protein M1825_004614 [Sarcosagium campestre]